ncbi:MAG: hypothetical protein AAGB04_28975 [Pseudomonadota bacterium]
MSFFTQDMSGCFAEVIGSNGLSNRELQAIDEEAIAALSRLRIAVRAGTLPFARLDQTTEALAATVEETYERLAIDSRTIMFFGCGAAGKIAQTIAQFGGWSIPGVMSGTQRRRPVTRFYSSADPVTIAGALSRSDLDKTRFVFASKDGDVSTVAQLLAALEAVRQSGHCDSIASSFLVMTGPAQPGVTNGLLQLSEHLGIPCLQFPADIDESFAALTVAGLLPAAARGLDIRKILDGAKSVVEEVTNETQTDQLALSRSAAMAVALSRYRNCRHEVIVPLDDRLAELAGYWAQLLQARGSRPGQSETIIASRGVQDLVGHLETAHKGSTSSYLTVLQTTAEEAGPRLRSELATIAGVDGLAGRTLRDLNRAQQRALQTTRRNQGQPMRTISLPTLNESALGALLMHMMLEAILVAEMLGLQHRQATSTEYLDHETLAALQAVNEKRSC